MDYVRSKLLDAEGRLAAAITALASQLAVQEKLGRPAPELASQIARLQTCRKTVTEIRRECGD